MWYPAMFYTEDGGDTFLRIVYYLRIICRYKTTIHFLTAVEAKKAYLPKIKFNISLSVHIITSHWAKGVRSPAEAKGFFL
jgi:hypothetical protein